MGNQIVQPSSHLLLTAVSAPGDMEMPLAGSSGHRDFPSLLGITPQLCAAVSFPTAIATSLTGAWGKWAVEQWTRVTPRPQLYLCKQKAPGIGHLLPSALCSREGLRAGTRAAAFPQTTCHLVSAACNGASVCITSPLRHAPSSSPALYIVTGNGAFATAARGALVIGSTLFLLPQGMESWWVVWTARKGNNAVSIAWSKFLSRRLVLLFTKQQ